MYRVFHTVETVVFAHPTSKQFTQIFSLKLRRPHSGKDLIKRMLETVLSLTNTLPVSNRTHCASQPMNGTRFAYQNSALPLYDCNDLIHKLAWSLNSGFSCSSECSVIDCVFEIFFEYIVSHCTVFWHGLISRSTWPTCTDSSKRDCRTPSTEMCPSMQAKADVIWCGRCAFAFLGHHRCVCGFRSRQFVFCVHKIRSFNIAAQ